MTTLACPSISVTFFFLAAVLPLAWRRIRQLEREVADRDKVIGYLQGDMP